MFDENVKSALGYQKSLHPLGAQEVTYSSIINYGLKLEAMVQIDIISLLFESNLLTHHIGFLGLQLVHKFLILALQATFSQN